MKKHNKNVRAQKLSRKKLTQQEYLMYEEIGMVDESQDWLELFTPARINDLFVIMESCSDNQLKAEAIQKELKGIGFETIGEGTNILTMANPLYPGVCFKIALDDCGLADNHNDSVLEEMVNSRLKKPRYNHVLAKHPSGMVTVQERKVPILDQDRMDEFRSSIIDTLTQLAADFLIVDLGPNDFHLNYGVERNGDWCFIDASDLYPLENLPAKIRCTRLVKYDEKAKKAIRCGGKLRYTSDFGRIFCPECKGTFLPSEIRPKDKEDKKTMRNAMLDGMTREEREKMRQTQMVRVGGKVREITIDVPEAKPADSGLPTTDNPETVVVKNPALDVTTDQFLGRFKKPEAPKPVEKKAAEEEAAVRQELHEELVEALDKAAAEAPKTGPDADQDYSPDDLDPLVEDANDEQDPIQQFNQLKEAVSDSDEEEEVTRSGIQEPTAEAVADLEPISENPEATTDDSDDEDEEEPHLVDATGDAESEEDGPDASEEKPPVEVDVDDDDDEIDILYSIVTDEDDPNWGINMKFVGDPMKALEQLTMPIFVWLNDKTYARAINTEQMKNLIRPVLQSLLEDM